MSRGTICAQLFGLAVLLAALFALPQGAQAHAGHAHSAAVHAQHVHPQADARATDVSAPAAHAIEQQSVRSLAVADAPGHRSASPCSDRGCCGQGTCAMCLSLDAPTSPLLMPPSHGAEIGLSANPLPAGIAGPSLQRPPRSFA